MLQDNSNGFKDLLVTLPAEIAGVQRTIAEEARRTAEAARMVVIDKFQARHALCDLFAVYWRVGHNDDGSSPRAVTITYLEALQYIRDVECFRRLLSRDKNAAYQAIAAVALKQPRPRRPVKIKWHYASDEDNQHLGYPTIEVVTAAEVLQVIFNSKLEKKKEEERNARALWNSLPSAD